MNTYNFNTDASTTPLFRFNAVLAQVKSNREHLSNPALQIIYDEIIDILTNAVDFLSEELDPQTYFFQANRYVERIKTKEIFLSALREIVKTKSYDYDNLKFTIAALDEGYLLGKDDLEEISE